MTNEEKMEAMQAKLAEGVLAKAEARIAKLEADIEELNKKSNRLNSGDAAPVNALSSAIQTIVQAPELKTAYDNRGKYTVEIKGNPYDLEKKSIVYSPNGTRTVSDDIRGVLAAQNRPGIIPYRLRPLAIRDLLNVVPTTDKFISYVREIGNTNNAAYVSMANLKPESAMSFQVETAQIETLAHTITCPLQLARDVNAFEAWLTNKMTAMLRIKSETAYLYGSGTSPEIRGITNFANIQTLTQVYPDNRIDTFRKALNKLEVSFYPWADNAILHPNDVMAMELLKDNEDRYLWPVFGSWATGVNANKSLFGVPIVSTTAITENTALIGNFAQGVTLYQREAVNVRVSFDTLDYFQRNLMMIRVESDECLVPEDAKCFCLTTFLGGTYA